MRGPRNLLWLVPVATLVTAPLWWGTVGGFLAPRSDVVAGGQQETAQKPQSFVMDDVRFTQHQSGAVEWKIDSRHVSSANSGDVLLLDGVVADLFQDGVTSFHIVSKAGRYDQKKQELGLAGDVKVKRRQGGILYAEQLYYLDATDRIRTSSKVRMVGDGLNVRGKGLSYDLNSGSYQIGGRVKVEIKNTGTAR